MSNKAVVAQKFATVSTWNRLILVLNGRADREKSIMLSSAVSPAEKSPLCMSHSHNPNTVLSLQASGNRVSRQSVLCGSQNIILNGKVKFKLELNRTFWVCMF